MSDIEKVLGTVKEAIEIERFGYDFYNSMRDFVKDGNGQKLVSHLARLEVDHIKWLEEEYHRQLEKLDELRDEPEEKISILGKEEIFLEQDKLPDIFREFDPIKAIDFAIGIENRSVDFYEKNMDISEDDKTKELFKRLADFERDHIIILEENLKSLQEIGQWRGSSIK
ncbi:MAG: ferritin family protein [Thermoplasmata archaeon]|nr:MAG: ferritin family protein [Thermoplasmata archaeon]